MLPTASRRSRNRSGSLRSSWPRRRFAPEPLEDRILLSITAGGDELLEGDLSSTGTGLKGSRQYVADELLVGFEGEVAEVFRGGGAAAALAAAGRVVGPFGLSGGRVLTSLPEAASDAARLATKWQLPAGANVLDAVTQLSGQPGIAYAEPNWIQQIAITTPNDPDFPQLWGMHDTAGAEADLDGPEAWDISTGSLNVVVADIDTGIDYTHEDLYLNIYLNQGEIPAALGAIDDTDGDGLITFYDLNDAGQTCSCVSDLNGNGRIDAGDLFADPAWADGNDDDGNGFVDDISGWDFINDDNNPFDDNDHGTHTAGTVGGIGDNAVGVVGANWKVQIMGVKFLSAGGSGSTADAIDSVNYVATTPAKLSTNSWGGGGFSTGLKDAIAASRDAGQLFIAAAGNANSNNDSSPHYPSSYNVEDYPNVGDKDNVIAVAAIDENNNKASFSSYGATSVDVASAGVGVLSTIPGNGYANFNGTSMATPHVSGTAALAWAVDPGASFEDIRQCIFDSAIANPVPDFTGGSTPILTGGRVNAYQTLQCVGMAAIAVSPAAGEIVHPTPPTAFVVQFSHLYNTNPAGELVEPGDLTVNGIPADSVDLTDPDGMTVTFQYSTGPGPGGSPVTIEGVQTIHMAAGAVEAAAGSGLADPLLKEFNATFRYDATLMAVVSTTPADGSDVALPLTSLQLHLNEDYDQASVGTNDVSLSQGSVTGFNFVDSDTIEYTLGGINQEETLTIQLAAGALTDMFGNPNVAYSGTLNLDIGTVPYPVPLAPKAPLGSLIYDPTASGLISSTDDTDSFTIDLDPGQTMTVLVEPGAGLRPRVELHDTSGMLAAAEASAIGESALIQAVATTSATTDTYTVVVSGVDDTTDSYTVQILVNSLLEEESNDDIGSAQDINASFIPLVGTAERGAVMGGIEDSGCVGPDGFGYEACVVETPEFDDISATGTVITQLQNTDDGSQLIKKGGKPSGFSFDFYGSAINEKDIYASTNGLVTIDAGNTSFGNGDLSSFPDQATIAAFWDDLMVDGPGDVYWQIKGAGNDQYVVVQWDQVRFLGGPAGDPVTFQVVLRENFGNPYIQLNYADLTSGAFGDEGAGATVGIKAAGVQGANRLLVSLNNGPNKYVGTGLSTRIGVNLPSNVLTEDHYAFDLAANERATVVLHTSGGNASVQLQNGAGTTVSSVVSPGPSNVAMAVEFAGGAAGTYYAVVTGDSQVQYRVVVVRGGTFDFEDNSGPEPWNGDDAQTIVLNSSAVVLGSIGGGIGGGGTIGYYTDGNSGSIGPEAPIVQAGFTPIQITNITSFNFDTIDVLMVDEWSNSGLSAAMLGRLGDIETWVQNGGAFIVHDRYVSSGAAEPNPFVIGAPGVLVQRDFAFDTDLNVIPPGATLVTDGPFGVIDDSSLDGGSSSSHGFADATTFPTGAVSILSAGPDTNHVAAFSYPLQGGAVYYSTIPLDFYLDGNGPNPPRENFNTIYTPNALAYVHGLLVPEVDFFAFTVVGGVEGTLELHTTTPAGGPGEFVNDLDPLLQLYDASGVLIAADDNGAGDGRNAQLQFAIPFSASPRTFYVAVMASDLTLDPTRGEYVLSAEITGAAPITDIGINTVSAPDPVTQGDSVDVDVTVQNWATST